MKNKYNINELSVFQLFMTNETKEKKLKYGSLVREIFEWKTEAKVTNFTQWNNSQFN